MTGPEHYAEAERLAAESYHEDRWEKDGKLLARAQVHATLALTAATMTRSGLTVADRHEWQKAIDPEYDAAVAAARTAAHDPAGPGWAEVTR